MAERERVDQAVQESRQTGTTPEALLVAGGAITADGLARAVAQRHGLDHLDLTIFGAGYKGRIGLYEVMRVTEEIRSLAIERASADRIGQAATRDGMRRLRDDGLGKIALGLTSVAEVARVTGTG